MGASVAAVAVGTGDDRALVKDAIGNAAEAVDDPLCGVGGEGGEPFIVWCGGEGAKGVEGRVRWDPRMGAWLCSVLKGAQRATATGGDLVDGGAWGWTGWFGGVGGVPLVL